MNRLEVILLLSVLSVILFCLYISSSVLRTYAQSPSSAASASSCTFTRGDQNPQALSYKSPLLLQYFQQASKQTNIPAALLAGITRVEVPSASSYTDDDVRAIEKTVKEGTYEGKIPGTDKVLCPTSSTGARGIMQIQPAGTRGHDSDALDNGARFLGKTAADLTLADYCDPKTEMILAAGFIVKKLQLKHQIGNGKDWEAAWNTDKNVIDSAADSYYGCLNYGDPNRPNACAGPYSYGDDIWASMQNCKDTFAGSIGVPGSGNSSRIGATMASNEVITRVGNPRTSSPGTGSGVHPKAPPPPDDVRQAIIDKFGITMDGFNHDNLVWAWEKFWDVSNTHFIELAKGTTLTEAAGRIPEQLSCTQIVINNSANQQRLNVILLHELGHKIDHCNPEPLSHHEEHEQVYAKEKNLTGYGLPNERGQACFGTPAVNEDYAEMITYYLNPGVKELIECNRQDQVPFADGKYPLHYQLAKKILGDY